MNILIISHFFPPSPSVGGRRWAKFTKYLAKNKDVNVHVISAISNVSDVKGGFQNELKNVSFKHTQLPSNYPKYLDMLDFAKSSFFSKIMFRVQLFFLKKKVEGNYWDFSVLWKEHFEKRIPEIIKNEKIDKVIISGTPFRYVHYGVEMMEKFPNIELILDYRDPWNDFNNPYAISDERHKFEIELEKRTLKRVDKIITVSEFQKELILKNQPNAAPVFVVPNGFDHLDYELEPKKSSEKITLIHFGTLHVLKEYYWRPFLLALKKLKETHAQLYDKIEVEFVGHCPIEIIDFISENNLKVKLYGMMDPFDAYQVLNQADIALWFKYDKSPGDFATKFGDYISLKKFIWTFSVKGTVTDYIEEHKIGKVFYRSTSNLQNEIYNAFLQLENSSERTFNKAYDSEQLKIENLTKKLVQVLINPA